MKIDKLSWGAKALFLVFSALISIVHAGILCKAWGWFIAPIFSLPLIPLIPMIVIIICVNSIIEEKFLGYKTEVAPNEQIACYLAHVVIFGVFILMLKIIVSI